ncbi:MAG: succinyldiaminopimelate transaminase [Gammaproteobacteria bacterium]|nr:MAG: succinyldiaminopimelate transaminase [Gammaproteobacteria bacterium]
MNPRLASLQTYPFQKLAKLHQGCNPPAGLSRIALSIGAPKHAAPGAALAAMRDQLHTLAHYPSIKGEPGLRNAMANWANKRFGLVSAPLDPEQDILPVAGTREALFSFAQAVVDRSDQQRPVIIMPNPFYQIYEGAALLAGAEPWFLNCTAQTHYRMDFSAVPSDVWARTQMVYLCTPANPTGAVMSENELQDLITLSLEHDFIIASDECYSEIYFDEQRPPPGLLQVAARLGIKNYKRCIVFHSLSKRSNLPGLRSGFVAGDRKILVDYFQYRTYHGSTLSPPVQAASIVAWNDEAHVAANREQYRKKFVAILDILGDVLDVQRPEAGFYLWPRTPVSDTEFARGLYDQQHVAILPGSYLSRQASGLNPGQNHVRMALVAPVEECAEAGRRIRNFIETL